MTILDIVYIVIGGVVLVVPVQLVANALTRRFEQRAGFKIRRLGEDMVPGTGKYRNALMWFPDKNNPSAEEIAMAKKAWLTYVPKLVLFTILWTLVSATVMGFIADKIL